MLCVRGQTLEPQAYFDAMGVFGKQMPQPSASANHPVVKDLLILSSEDRDVLAGYGEFLKARLTRLYPLHVFMLLTVLMMVVMAMRGRSLTL